MLGHEATGVVIDKHSTVKKVNIKDRVVLSWIKSSGIESEKPNYYYPIKNKNKLWKYYNF